MSLRGLIGTVLIAIGLVQVPCPAGAAAAADSTLPIATTSDVDPVAKNATGQRRQGRVCGWIGVEVRPMTRAFADSLGMTEPYGAIFSRPQPGSPAAKAKIEPYDVVTAVNGAPLRSWRDFAKIISSMAPGTQVYLTTWRSGQLIDVRVMLGRKQCRYRS